LIGKDSQLKKGQQAYIQQTNTNPSIQDKNAQIIDWDEDTLPSGNRFFLWILTCIIGPLGLAFCFITQPLFYPELKIGDTAYQDLRATFTGQLENEAATKAARLKARGSVVPVFKPIAIKYDEFDKDIKLELNKVQALQKHLQKNDSNTVNTFNIAAPDYYEIYIARAVPSKEFESFARELSISAQTVNRALPRFSVDNASFWQEAVEAFLPYNWTTNLKKQVALLICYRLHPNLMINQNATLEKSEQLTAAVKPVMFDIKPGMILLKKGEIVNGENIKLLEASGANGQIRWPLIFMLVLSLVA
jgi:membrane-associated HD superfamily phosphohydrolase